jgi:hypothetical protein
MLKRLLAVAVTLAVLICAATVGLEAVGLLFRAGAPDPQRRIEAYVARLEADLSPVDLPTEPVDAPREVAEEPPQPAQDGAGSSKVADSPDPTGPEGVSDDPLSVAVSGPVATPRPEIAARPDQFVTAVLPEPLSESREPAPPPALPAAQASTRASAAAPPAQRAAGARRPRLAQRPTGYAAFGWPVLDWLTL